ncbi:tellurite resistance TerB family protein [Thalassococcus sp. S3]|uniref:tellurite resistance TerB family protein n=1 Tax=Thalassococcus sp. S3 TaxID=2017482 RepID=UPI0010242FAD|nr:tellurite resistance TerB family protein [Thalassococcus sp. S3]QBF31606.1 protein YebE [Thalassococcus sp. S3]
MGLMGTLAKVAIGYAAARGVDHLSGGKGLAGLMGGAQVPSREAQAEQAPGMDQLQQMMAGSGLQDMMTKMSQSGMGGLQDMMNAMTGGTTGAGTGTEDKGGLLSSVPGGGAGMAGILAAMGGAAAMSGKGVGGLLDQFNTRETAPEAEEAAGLMLRAMIQAAKADGDIDEAEKAKILETLGDDADAEDIAFVQQQLAAPVDVEALAADTPAAQAMQVYSMSLMSIRVDTAAEAQYLDSLAKALGLNQQTVNALHVQMGVQPLYS